MEIGSNGGMVGQASVRQTDAGQGSMGKNDFMKLLVAQLQNQDPMEPMDARETITQLTELTSVEQLVAIEGRMQSLEVGMAGVANTQVAGIVGRSVVADGSSLRLGGTGDAQGLFELAGRAEDVTVTIRDANGDPVRELTLGAQPPGQQAFSWDGMGDDGERLPPGRYSVEVRALDENGQQVAVEQQVRGLVEGIRYQDGIPELMIGDARVLLGDVESIEL